MTDFGSRRPSNRNDSDSTGTDADADANTDTGTNADTGRAVVASPPCRGFEPLTIDHDPDEGDGKGAGRAALPMAATDGGLDRLAATIRDLHRELGVETLRRAFEIGSKIEDAAVHLATRKALGEWLEGSCGIAVSTGYAYRRVYATFKDHTWLIADLTITDARRLSRVKAAAEVRRLPTERPLEWGRDNIAELVEKGVAIQRASKRRPSAKAKSEPPQSGSPTLSTNTDTRSTGADHVRRAPARLGARTPRFPAAGLSITPGQPYDADQFAEWLVGCAHGRTDQLLEWIRAMDKADVLRRLEAKLEGGTQADKAHGNAP